MTMRKCILNGIATFLVLAILSFSLLTITPVQESDGWPVHFTNCKVEITLTPPFVKIVCDIEIHTHLTPH